MISWSKSPGRAVILTEKVQGLDGKSYIPAGTLGTVIWSNDAYVSVAFGAIGSRVVSLSKIRLANGLDYAIAASEEPKKSP